LQFLCDERQLLLRKKAKKQRSCAQRN